MPQRPPSTAQKVAIRITKVAQAVSCSAFGRIYCCYHPQVALRDTAAPPPLLGTAVMPIFRGDSLPPVSEQRPRPALAWAEASSVAPAPRQPSTPRIGRGRPCGVGHGGAVPGSSGLGTDQIRRPRALQPPRSSAPVTLEDLPYMRRLDMRIREPRMGSRTSRQLVSGAFAAPELLPGVELARGGAVGNQTSDIESTSDQDLPSPGQNISCRPPVFDERGRTYSGQWEGDTQHGHGTEVSSDGTRYEGDFRKGLKHGVGKFSWK
ncbi:unnamed protein product, partial [Prorocentrum cordatum]